MPSTPHLSSTARSIGASVTLQLNAEAARLRSAGEPVMHLGGGEPQSLAPQSAVDAGMDRLRTGAIRYTPASGTPELKDAVVSYTAEYYGREAKRENVMISAGAKQALMVALIALLDAGDEVVFPVPYWVSYPEMVSIAGGVSVPVEADPETYEPTLAAMLAALTDRTRVVLLNSPSNPSGKVLNRELLSGIIVACQERGITLVVDDIYHRLVFDDLKVPHCYECTAAKIDEAGIVVINGVSKQYAMTGFRIGWAVGPSKLIRAMSNLQSHLTGGPSTVSQVAATAALIGDQSSVGQLRLDLQDRRDRTIALLDDIPGVEYIIPQGTFYCFADFSAIDSDSTRLANHILQKVQVVTVPGIEFGMEGYLRLSYCGALADIEEGLRR
ncbi:MAG: aspartate aminotransferase, partial [Candidatus Krumholzibacteriia bacterium]